MFFLFKAVVTGLVVALVSYLGRRYPAGAGMLAALPIISVGALSFLFWETGGDTSQVARLSTSIGWMVLPTTLFLFVFPVLLRRQMSFASALGVALTLMLACHALLFLLLREFDDQ